MPRPRPEAALGALERDGLLRREGEAFRTTRRWQAAMARASLRLLGGDAPPDDLRAPIASALLELYGGALGDDELVERIAVLCPIEAAELAPRSRGAV